MAKIALWRIEQEGPEKLRTGAINLEKDLEDWIENDPSLLQYGLRIVGRQVTVEGGRLDLLALDPLGRWAVIEIKAGSMFSDVIGQAMYYASSIAKMPYTQLRNKIEVYLASKGVGFSSVLYELRIDEQTLKSQVEREVLMILVGAGSSEGLRATLDYFSRTYGFPVSLISFDVFEFNGGPKILTRELTDLDFPNSELEKKKKRKYSIETVCALADESRIGSVFRSLLKEAQNLGLFARPYATSIMYTPPQRHDRMLFTVWAEKRPGNSLKAYVGSNVFAEFFPVTEEKAISFFGPIGWREMTGKDIASFVENLKRFFDEVKDIKE